MLAIAVLHNFFLTKSRGSYLPSGFVDKEDLETGEVIPVEGKQNIPAFFPLEISSLRKLQFPLKLLESFSKITL